MTNTIDVGPTVNVNRLMQEHISEGGKLELVVGRDGHTSLDWLLTEKQTETLKAELEAV